MVYWWVNQNEAFKADKHTFSPIIWCKQKESWATYKTLKLAEPSDIVFYYADQQILAIGEVKSRYKIAKCPFNFKKVKKDELGWALQIEWHKLTVSFSVRGHTKLKKHFPKAHSPLKNDLKGIEKVFFTFIPKSMAKCLIDLIAPQNNFPLISSLKERILLDDLDQRNTDLNLPLGKFRKQVIDSRIGQGEFRDKILERYGACIVTKVTEKSLLVASHIMPWRISKVDACLDENNGLLLSPHIDRLFDQGFISFADNGDLMVKDESIREVLKMWRIEYPLNVGSFNVKQKKYLKYHRTHIFKK